MADVLALEYAMVLRRSWCAIMLGAAACGTQMSSVDAGSDAGEDAKMTDAAFSDVASEADAGFPVVPDDPDAAVDGGAPFWCGVAATGSDTSVSSTRRGTCRPMAARPAMPPSAPRIRTRASPSTAANACTRCNQVASAGPTPRATAWSSRACSPRRRCLVRLPAVSIQNRRVPTRC